VLTPSRLLPTDREKILVFTTRSLSRHWARDWRALALTQAHHGRLRLSDSCEDGEALSSEKGILAYVLHVQVSQQNPDTTQRGLTRGTHGCGRGEGEWPLRSRRQDLDLLGQKLVRSVSVAQPPKPQLQTAPSAVRARLCSRPAETQRRRAGQPMSRSFSAAARAARRRGPACQRLHRPR